MKQIKLLAICFVLFIIIDFIWLGLVANSYYMSALSHLLEEEKFSESPLRIAAALFTYLLLIFSVVFVAYPLSRSSKKSPFLCGAFVGFIIYGVYEGTNLATLNDWPPLLLIIDSLWGAFLCATLTKAVSFADERLLK